MFTHHVPTPCCTLPACLPATCYPYPAPTPGTQSPPSTPHCPLSIPLPHIPLGSAAGNRPLLPAAAAPHTTFAHPHRHHTCAHPPPTWTTLPLRTYPPYAPAYGSFVCAAGPYIVRAPASLQHLSDLPHVKQASLPPLLRLVDIHPKTQACWFPSSCLRIPTCCISISAWWQT